MVKPDLRLEVPDLSGSFAVVTGANGQVGNGFVIVQNKPGDKVDIVFPKDVASGDAIAPIPAK